MIGQWSGAGRAASWMLVAATGFALMSTGVKLATDVATPLQTAFLRSGFGALLVLPMLVSSGTAVTAVRWRSHLLRGSAGIAAMLLYFAALARLPVSTAMALNSTSGLFLPLLAWVLLAEPPSRHVATGIACGFIGVLLLVSPERSGNWPGSLLGLASGFLLALAHLSIRRLGRDREPVLVQMLAFNLIGTLITGCLLALSDGWPSGRAAVLWGLAIAAAATVGQFGLVSALAIGPAAQVAALGFVALAFAACMDFVLIGSAPSAGATLGMALIVIGAWKSQQSTRLVQ